MEKLHVQPSELDVLPYYEFEYMVEIYNEIIKERNEDEHKNTTTAEEQYNVSSIAKNMTKYKPPPAPKISIPRLK